LTMPTWVHTRTVVSNIRVDYSHLSIYTDNHLVYAVD
jgi:hypothetical protein